jgi:2-oxoglutarate ferredoxin oxidoreductase subunit alpha
MTRKLLQGNEACVEAAIAAGVRFFAGYPITPATEISEGMARQLPEAGGVFIQMEDEIGSIAACIGASVAGARAMTATSGPGISLMLENLGFAVISETPVVLVNVMRGGPSTGLPTFPAQMDVMQARWGAHGDYPCIAYAPSSVAETYDLTVRAVNTAELLRTPVFLLSDALVGHMREAIDVPDPAELKLVERSRPQPGEMDFAPHRSNDGRTIPPMARFGDGFHFHVDSNVHDEYGFPATERNDVANWLVRRLNDKVRAYADELLLVEEDRLEDAEIGIFTFGSTARSAAEAVDLARARGWKVGLLKTMTLWPFPEKYVEKWTRQVRAWLVPELNLGQMVREVRLVVQGRVPVYQLNRVDGLLIEPQQILSLLDVIVSGDEGRAQAVQDDGTLRPVSADRLSFVVHPSPLGQQEAP